MNKKNFMNAIREFRNQDRLHKRVVREILEDARSYSGKTFAEKVEKRLEDIAYGGLSTGIVGSLIYYSDTVKFYELYKEDIFDLFEEKATLYGESLGAYLSGFKGFDTSDYFIRGHRNMNYCAWAAYEIIASDLSDIIYDLD